VFRNGLLGHTGPIFVGRIDMDDSKTASLVEKAIENGNGILKLRPAWVARDFLPPGRRLGLREEEYDAGERGYICERWLASVTKADNRISPEDEGLSYLAIEGEDLLLRDAVRVAGSSIMGEEYAKTHNGLGRLIKIYDFASRIHYHIHQMEEDARKVGKNSKDEAYYFLEDVDMGAHPETFFGVHPYIVRQGKQYEMLLPHLVDWNSDLILKHSRAYLNAPGEGFHLPSGVLHAPGTALTLELQEDSDVFAMLQAKIGERITPKELLFKDVSPEDREKLGERAVLDQVNWEVNADPFFYENRHLEPIPVEETRQDGGLEHWIYYNTSKFSGKRLTLQPGKTFNSKDNGVYSILVWKGSGTVDGSPVKAGDHGSDELLITHKKAVDGFEIRNTGSEDLVLFKFFGPDINTDIPYIQPFSG
jgi:mannose-6-phosphate isomerase class I